MLRVIGPPPIPAELQSIVHKKMRELPNMCSGVKKFNLKPNSEFCP